MYVKNKKNPKLKRIASTGRGSANEDAEHGEVPAYGHGHGTSYGKEKPEQLESALPLVAMETAVRDGS